MKRLVRLPTFRLLSLSDPDSERGGDRRGMGGEREEGEKEEVEREDGEREDGEREETGDMEMGERAGQAKAPPGQERSRGVSQSMPGHRSPGTEFRRPAAGGAAGNQSHGHRRAPLSQQLPRRALWQPPAGSSVPGASSSSRRPRSDPARLCNLQLAGRASSLLQE
jgi:hypothetical protein